MSIFIFKFVLISSNRTNKSRVKLLFVPSDGAKLYCDFVGRSPRNLHTGSYIQDRLYIEEALPINSPQLKGTLFFKENNFSINTCRYTYTHKQTSVYDTIKNCLYFQLQFCIYVCDEKFISFHTF